MNIYYFSSPEKNNEISKIEVRYTVKESTQSIKMNIAYKNCSRCENGQYRTT